jgi:regulator of RNase E activity RraA
MQSNASDKHQGSMMVGFRILARQREVDSCYTRAFAEIPVANVSDCMMRMSAGGPRLRPLHKSGRLVGPALTVKTRPGDNVSIHGVPLVPSLRSRHAVLSVGD